MERDQEVQGQVTQMSFSLKLILHTMEVNNLFTYCFNICCCCC